MEEDRDAKERRRKAIEEPRSTQAGVPLRLEPPGFQLREAARLSLGGGLWGTFS